jgi:hypothetical protein
MHSVEQMFITSNNFADHTSWKNAAESFEKKNNALTVPCEETIVKREVWKKFQGVSLLDKINICKRQIWNENQF